MDRGQFSPWHVCPSMIVRDLDFVGVASVPAETDSPLIVDPDTVLPFPVTVELFESVPSVYRVTLTVSTEG